jgi:iron complex outermembrane receptor protein
MVQGQRVGLAVAAMAWLANPGIAFAQRAAENAVTSADDAFGTAVGLESIGIYSESDTRGFSPVKAGNARIDGIYYDPIGNLSGRVRSATTIRVGPATRDYPFNAPTGVVDYQFKTFPAETGLSLGYSFGAFGGWIRDSDLRLPLANGHIGITGGLAGANLQQSDGSYSQSYGITVRPIIRFGRTEIAPFTSFSKYTINYAHPLVVVSDHLPALPPKRLFLGQNWSRGAYHNNQFGVTLKTPVVGNLSLRGGLFHAVGDRDSNFTEIFTISSPADDASYRLIADPEQAIHSTSGEALAAWRFGHGRLSHRLLFGYRARERYTESGGSDFLNFGTVRFGTLNPQPEPAFAFSPVNAGRVRQSAWMLGYLGALDGVGHLNLGLQRAHYSAVFHDGRTGIETTSRDAPWLYNTTLTVELTRALSVYAGTQRGLEDSGAAPENAVNRLEQLPATRTTQYEGGLRWHFTGGQLVVSAFQITKPYFAFDATNRFEEVGLVRHRGVEASLSLHLVDGRLTAVAGGLLMQPRVSGEARDLGLVGERPAGTPSLVVRLDANYRTDLFGGLTPTSSFVYFGERAAGARPLAALGGRQLMLHAYATFDLGLRQQFKVGHVPASFRAVVQNAFDAKTWKVVAASTLYPEERRRFSLSFAADF